MPAAPLPDNENDRRAALLALNILDRTDALDFSVFPQMATQALSMPISSISLVDADRQWFMASVGLEDTETPRSSSFCAYTILQPGEVLCVPDATADPRFADNPLVFGEFGLRAYAGASILGPKGHAIGALCVIDRQTRQFTRGELTMLVTLARSVSHALKLHGALEELRRQESERSLLQATLAASFEMGEVPVLIVRASGAILLGNTAYRSMAGYTGDEMTTLYLKDLLAADHQAVAGAAHARQGATGEPYKIDSVVLHSNGTRIPVQMTSAVVQRPDTQPFRVITLRPRQASS